MSALKKIRNNPHLHFTTLIRGFPSGGNGDRRYRGHAGGQGELLRRSKRRWPGPCRAQGVRHPGHPCRHTGETGICRFCGAQEETAYPHGERQKPDPGAAG